MTAALLEKLRDAAARRIERRVVSHAPRSVNYLRPIDPWSATGLVGDTYRQITADFLVAAPLVLHSPFPPLLAAAWSLLRETAIAAGRVPRAQKEAIATGVSIANTCPYCVDVHAMMLDASSPIGVGPQFFADRAAASRGSTISELASWGRHSLNPYDPIVRRPPFDARDDPELIGTAVTFHYLNRMVTLFLGESPLRLPPALRWLRRVAGRAASATFGHRITTLAPAPGSSLSLLPAAPLPADFQWAAANDAIAGAVARTAFVILRCFPALRQLRPSLSREALVPAVRRMECQGYRLVYLEEAGTVRAVACYRSSRSLHR